MPRCPRHTLPENSPFYNTCKTALELLLIANICPKIIESSDVTDKSTLLKLSSEFLEKLQSRNRVRRQLYGKQPTPLPPLDGYTRQGVPIVIGSYADSKHLDTSLDGRKELGHYRDFVNDPWVNTEDLGQIVQSRPRPKLRSGRDRSVDDDISTQRRQHQQQQHYQQQQHQTQPQPQRIHSPLPTSSSWARVPDPYRLAGENPRGLTRVVDLRSGTEQLVRDNQRRNSYGGSSSTAGGGRISYQPTRTYQTESRAWHTQPEQRSLDSTSSQGQNQGQVREGNRVRASSSDSHVTWRKVGSESGAESNSGRVHRQGPEAYGHATRSRESWTVRPATRYDTNYPIMNDRETAQKAERNGLNIMVRNH